MPDHIEPQTIAPDKDSDYSDGFYARLYGTLVSFGHNEQRLIWTRYAGFLVLQGFIIHTATRDDIDSTLLLGLSIIGIAISASWHVLNYSGWLNQNIWFTMAARLHFTGLSVPLPTDWWTQGRALRPTGKIYSIAQSVPIVLLIGYGFAMAWALKELKLRVELAATLTVICVVLAFLVSILIERAEYKDRKNEEDDRAIA